MKTEHRLAQALKEMLAKVPLESISVTSLSERCDVSRKTFYYHFHDIYDLLTLVFLNEKIDGIQSAKTPKDVLSKIYSYYQKNSGFIDATIDSAGRDLFEEFIFNVCYQSFLRIINLSPESKQITLNEKKAIVRFYTAGFSYAIVFYLSNAKHKSLEGLNNALSFLDNGFLQKAVDDLISNKYESEVVEKQ